MWRDKLTAQFRQLRRFLAYGLGQVDRVLRMLQCLSCGISWSCFDPFVHLLVFMHRLV